MRTLVAFVLAFGVATPAGAGTETFATERRQMVDETIEARGIRDPLVLEAMRSVPREEFVPAERRAEAYADRPLPIGEGQTISQPYIVALMTELAAVAPGSNVLEVGTGSGYQAAVLAACGATVYSIEIVDALAQRAKRDLARLGYAKVHVRSGDGYQGWPEHAPFDAILVTAAAPRVPPALLEQLRVGGRLVIPVDAQDGEQSLQVHTRTPDGVTVHDVVPVRFVPMTGTIRAKP